MVVFVYQGYRDTIDKFHGKFDTLEEAENHIYEDLVKEVQDFLDKMQQKRNGTYVSPLTQMFKNNKEGKIERDGLESYERTLSELEERDNEITEDALKSEKYYQNRDWKGEFRKVSQTPKGSIQQDGSWLYNDGNPPMYQGYSQRYEDGSGNYPYIIFDPSFVPTKSEMKAEEMTSKEKEIRKTAHALAQALTITDNKKFEVQNFEFLNEKGGSKSVLADFDMSCDGVSFDGGSYEVRATGEIKNVALRQRGRSYPVYAQLGDSVSDIVKRLNDLKNEKDSHNEVYKREKDEGFDAVAHLFDAEYSMLGGIREEFKDAESNLSEATLKRLRKTYDNYEDRNEHMSNYLLLATFFGTDKDKEEVKKIMARRNRRGYLTQKESTWLYENINPYYDHLRNVKAAETFEARYNQNGTIAYNEKEWVGDLGNERGAVFLGSDGTDRYYYIHKRIVKVVKGLKNETLVQPVIDFNDYRLDDLIDRTDERRKLAKIFDEVMKNYDRHTEYRRAETFDVEFNEWADQEMLTHGQDISFRDWAKEEGEKHGDMDLTDWAKDEEESHDERYEAEEFLPNGVLRYYGKTVKEGQEGMFKGAEIKIIKIQEMNNKPTVIIYEYLDEEGNPLEIEGRFGMKTRDMTTIKDFMTNFTPFKPVNPIEYGAETFEAKGLIDSAYCLNCGEKYQVMEKKDRVKLVCYGCSDYVFLPKSHLSDSDKRQLIMIQEGFEENEKNEAFHKKYPHGLGRVDVSGLFNAETFGADYIVDKYKHGIEIREFPKSSSVYQKGMLVKKYSGDGHRIRARSKAQQLEHNYKPKSFFSESKSTTKRNGMIAAGIVAAFALLPEIKKRF